MIDSLLRDISFATDAIPSGHAAVTQIRGIEKALWMEKDIVSRHPTTFFQSLWNLLYWEDAQELNVHLNASPRTHSVQDLTGDGAFSRLVTAWRMSLTHLGCMRPWLRLVRPPRLSLGSPFRSGWVAHDGPILDIAHCKTLILTLGEDEMRAWHPQSYELLASWPFTERPKCSTVLDNGDIFVGDEAGTLWLLTSDLGHAPEPVISLDSSIDAICHIAPHNILAVGTRDGRIELYHQCTYEIRGTFSAPGRDDHIRKRNKVADSMPFSLSSRANTWPFPGSIVDLAYWNEYDVLVSLHLSGETAIWKLDNSHAGTSIRVVWPPALLGGRSLCVIQEKNDSTVVVGYAKGTVGVIDMKCDLVRYFSIHDYGESAMGIAAYGNDGCMLSVSGDNTIRRTSIATGVSCVQKLFRTGGTCLALDKEASHAFIGCRDGSVCVVHLNFDSDYGGDLVGHRREMFDHLECPGGVLWTRSGEGRCIEWRIKDGVSLSERIIERVALYSVISRDSHPPAQHDLGLSLPRIDSVRHEQRGSTVLLKQPGGQAAFCAQHIRVCSFDPLHFFWFEDNYVGFAVLEGCEGLDASGSLKGNQFASELRG